MHDSNGIESLQPPAELELSTIRLTPQLGRSFNGTPTFSGPHVTWKKNMDRAVIKENSHSHHFKRIVRIPGLLEHVVGQVT